MQRIKSLIRFLIMYLVNVYYKLKFKSNSKKENILVYTDSRGFLVNCFMCNKTPKLSYIDMLSNDYNVTFQICPHKHTTIIDFLNYIHTKNVSKYQHIILHLGIVDFSPRPISQIDLVYNKKLKVVKKTFPNSIMNPNYYEEKYENENTFSLYDTFFLENTILPNMEEISRQTNLIWLGVNKVDIDWNGNYFKKRPSNINEILKYQNSIKSYLSVKNSKIKYIDIDSIDKFELKKHTVDNMHLSEEGFKLFYNILLKVLNK